VLLRLLLLVALLWLPGRCAGGIVAAYKMAGARASAAGCLPVCLSVCAQPPPAAYLRPSWRMSHAHACATPRHMCLHVTCASMAASRQQAQTGRRQTGRHRPQWQQFLSPSLTATASYCCLSVPSPCLLPIWGPCWRMSHATNQDPCASMVSKRQQARAGHRQAGE
jgi:hypothetical protein